MQGGTAATQEVFIEHVGIPILARSALRCRRCRTSACTARSNSSSPAASATAPTSPRRWRLAPMRCRSAPPRWSRWATTTRSTKTEYRKLGTTAGAYDDWQEGRDPAGITTQDPLLAARLDPVAAGRRLANYLAVLTLEAQTIARACGKSHLHNLDPEDLVALTIEAAAMAQVPLAGTDWIPARTASRRIVERGEPG